MAKKFFNHKDVKWPGAWLIEQEITQGVPDIPYNKTLFIQQLSDEAPDEPEFVDDCTTLSEVFDKFKPSKQVSMEDEDGLPVDDEDAKLEFKSMKDFGKDGIIKQSAFLQEIQHKQEMYTDFIKRLRSIAVLQRLLADKENKQDYLDAIKSFIDELGEIDPE